MKSILFRSGKLLVFSVVSALLVIAVSAQPKLRKAVDYDGDGKADLAIFRPSNAIWYIARTGGGFSYQQFGLANEDFMSR